MKIIPVLICAVSLLSAYASVSLAADGYTVVEDRSYTVSTIHFPALCKEAPYADSCRFFSSLLIGQFEHNKISSLSSELDFDNPQYLFDFDSEKASQEIFIDYMPIPRLDFASIVARITQKNQGKTALQVKVFSFNLKTQKMLRFNELFADPKLASRLCAAYIERNYSKGASEKLPLYLALIQVMPNDFMLLPDALEFVFPKGVLPKENQSGTVIIGLEELKQAGPVAKWFPGYQSKDLGLKERRDPLARAASEN